MNTLVTNQLGSGFTSQGQGTRRKVMKGKRKLSPNSTQAWTPLSSNPQDSHILSDDCHAGLRSIAQAVHDANVQYKCAVSDYLRWRNKLRNRTGPNPNLNRFHQDDLQTIEGAINAHLTLDKSLAPQLLVNLDDGSCISIWKRVAENMVYLKSLQKPQTPAHLEKSTKRATELKNCRTTMTTSFNLVERELRDSGHGSTCEAILAKIAMLLEYEEAYPVLPEPTLTVPEPRQESPYTFHTSTLISIDGMGLVISLIFMAMAWSKSTDTPGSPNDPDFWVQMRDTTLTLLGLLTTIYVTHQRLSADPIAWNYALMFTLAGIACAILAVVLYPLVPTMWSSFASFSANVMQILVTLQLALITKALKQKQL
ncbi:hypothetical protein Daesc_007872 [Daldinia eschscholtzii]|uniref:Uncharacterized protein n=1 Tax=Daldinia eschscholtzii TaxID=292717 RepID=A0AAX6MF57_9PEZI